MDAIQKALKRAGEALEANLKEQLAAQRSRMIDAPERSVRALGLQQMADHFEREAVSFLRMGEEFEALECRRIAAHALDFKKRILDGLE